MFLKISRKLTTLCTLLMLASLAGAQQSSTPQVEAITQAKPAALAPARPILAVGDQVFAPDQPDLGDGEIKRLIAGDKAVVKFEKGAPITLSISQLKPIYDVVAKPPARGAEAFMLFADIGGTSKVTLEDVQSAADVFFKRSSQNAIDVVIALGMDPADCVACERDGTSQAYTVIEMQRYDDTGRDRIWGSVGNNITNATGRTPHPMVTLKEALERFSKRYQDRNRSVFFITAGPEAKQTGDEETDHDWKVTKTATFEDAASPADREAARELAAAAKADGVTIHALQIPREVTVKVHYDPRGTCKFVMQQRALATGRSLIAEITAQTGGTYTSLAEMADAKNPMPKLSMDVISRWIDHLITEINIQNKTEHRYKVDQKAPTAAPTNIEK